MWWDGEKARTVAALLHNKNYKQSRNRRELPHPDKEDFKKPTADIIFNYRKLNAFSLTGD